MLEQNRVSIDCFLPLCHFQGHYEIHLLYTCAVAIGAELSLERSKNDIPQK